MISKLGTSDFGKKYGKLPCEVLDVGEGQFHVRAMVKTRKGSYRWPCKCAQFSEWVCCEEEGCTDKSWVESDSIVGRLNSGVPVKDGFMFEI